MNDMSEKLTAILMQVFDIEEDEAAQDLTREDVSKWDSLTHMDLVLTLENEFDIRLEVDDIIAMQSLDKIRQILKKFGVE